MSMFSSRTSHHFNFTHWPHLINIRWYFIPNKRRLIIRPFPKGEWGCETDHNKAARPGFHKTAETLSFDRFLITSEKKSLFCSRQKKTKTNVAYDVNVVCKHVPQNNRLQIFLVPWRTKKSFCTWNSLFPWSVVHEVMENICLKQRLLLCKR